MQTSPIVKVTIEQGDGSAVEYVVQTDNRDRVRHDLVTAQRGWPGAADAPNLWLSVMAWSALKRSGEMPDAQLDTFLERCLDVTPVDADGNRLTRAQIEGAADEVTPTK